MHPVTLLPRVLLPLLVATLWSAEAAASDSLSPRTGLALTCEIDGQHLPLVRVEEETLVLGSGAASMPAPAAEAARWTLAGDIRAQAALVRWSPAHTLARDARVADMRYRAIVSVTRKCDIAPRAESVRDPLLRRQAHEIERPKDTFTTYWPERAWQPAALVAVWLVGDRVVHTQVQAVPHPAAARDFRVEFDFSLTQEEGAGQPAVLLWREGGFVAPTPRFTHGPTEAAYHAVMADDTTALAAALAAGARLQSATEKDQTTLAHFAAERGALETLKAVITARPQLLNARTDDGATPVHRAAAKGRTDTLRWLLSRYKGKRAPVEHAESALLAAAQGGHADAVGLLLPVRPSHRPVLDDESIALRAAWLGGFTDVIRTFEAAGLPAAELESPAALNTAKPAAADLQTLALTSLIKHAAQGHLPMVQWMVAQGRIDLNGRADGETALVAAASRGHGGIVRLLLAHGADINQAAAGGMTPLMAGVRGGHAGLAAELLRAGARPNAANKEGMTAIHFAAEQGDTPLVALLLDSGADALICSIRDATPLDLALLCGANDSVRLLMERGACIGLGAPNSADLLLAALAHDIPAAVTTALGQGWPATSNLGGVWPALRVAEILGAGKCAQVLRAAGATAPADRPVPVVDASLLDAPVRVESSAPAVDPRPPEAEFPATTIRVQMLVDAQGRALFPRALDRGDPRATLALLKAARKTRFTPPRRDGQPVATLVTHDYTLPASRDRVFSESEVDRAVGEVRTTRPYLPEFASRTDRNARVVVEFVVNTLGRPEQLKIIQTSGPNYTDAALLALSQWTFRPASHRGRSVAALVTHTFTFDSGTGKHSVPNDSPFQ